MFNHLKLLGKTERSIVLQTRKGREVDNSIDIAPNQQQIDKFWRLVNKFPKWIVRLKPTGGYNCLGHVWASRRTGIFENLEQQIAAILTDDGYRTIQDSEAVFQPGKLHPGDLAAYWIKGRAGRLFVHVEQVVELRRLEGSIQGIPWVLSKLDSTSGEVLHHYRDVACDFDILEFWTDRPLD